jgi:hypothetical protein
VYKFLILALVLLGLSACPVTQPEQPKVARVEVNPGTVLLTASGQTKTLTAQAFDQNNKPMSATFSWVSSKPETVSINSGGTVQANAPLGSSQITASSDGVQSVAIVAAIVEPADGAILVSDSQVVVDPAMLEPKLGNFVGAKLKVTLTGVSNLAPGNLIVPSENKAFAGRVISSTDVGGGRLEVVLEQVPISTLLKHYSIDAVYQMNTPTTEQFSATSEAIAGKSIRADDPGFKFGPFTCKNKLSLSSISGDFTIKLEPDLKINYLNTENAKLISVTGILKSKVTGKVVLGANFTNTLTCKYKAPKPIILPIGGVLAVFVGLQVPYGIKLELKLNVQSPQLETAIEFKNTMKLELGYAWSTATSFKEIREFDSDSTLKGRFNYPTSYKNFRAEGSVGVFGYAELQAGSPIGDFFELTPDFSILELNLGERFDLKLASPQTQVDDSGYNSKYELKAVLEAGLGSDAKKRVQQAIEAWGAPEGEPTGPVGIQLKPSATVEYALTRSPYGKDTVDKKQVAIGEKVKLNVKLEPSSINIKYGLLPFQQFYNVKTVDFYRVRDGKDAEKVKSIDAADGQDNFDWEWTPAKADVGENKFYAFVVSKEFLDTTPLEITENSELIVNVTGDSFVTVGIVGSKTESYNAPATGSRSTSVDLLWKFDQSDKPSTIQAPGVIFGQPVPGFGSYYLKSSLSGTIKDKNDYKLDEACVCATGRDIQSSNFEYISGQIDVPTDLNIPIVNVQMEASGNYVIRLLIPTASIKGDFSKSVMQNEGCDEGDGLRTPVNDSFNGRLETSPYITLGTLQGKIDLSKETILQGGATFKSDAKGGYTRIDTTTPFSGSWSVPSTITVNWKLSFVVPTEGSSLKPPPFNTNVLPSFPDANANSDVFPWNGINRALETKHKPRC